MSMKAAQQDVKDASNKLKQLLKSNPNRNFLTQLVSISNQILLISKSSNSSNFNSILKYFESKVEEIYELKLEQIFDLIGRLILFSCLKREKMEELEMKRNWEEMIIEMLISLKVISENWENDLESKALLRNLYPTLMKSFTCTLSMSIKRRIIDVIDGSMDKSLLNKESFATQIEFATILSETLSPATDRALSERVLDIVYRVSRINSNWKKEFLNGRNDVEEFGKITMGNYEVSSEDYLNFLESCNGNYKALPINSFSLDGEPHSEANSEESTIYFNKSSLTFAARNNLTEEGDELLMEVEYDSIDIVEITAQNESALVEFKLQEQILIGSRYSDHSVLKIEIENDQIRSLKKSLTSNTIAHINGTTKNTTSKKKVEQISSSGFERMMIDFPPVKQTSSKINAATKSISAKSSLEEIQKFTTKSIPTKKSHSARGPTVILTSSMESIEEDKLELEGNDSGFKSFAQTRNSFKQEEEIEEEIEEIESNPSQSEIQLNKMELEETHEKVNEKVLQDSAGERMKENEIVEKDSVEMEMEVENEEDVILPPIPTSSRPQRTQLALERPKKVMKLSNTEEKKKKIKKPKKSSQYQFQSQRSQLQQSPQKSSTASLSHSSHQNSQQNQKEESFESILTELSSIISKKVSQKREFLHSKTSQLEISTIGGITRIVEDVFEENREIRKRSDEFLEDFIEGNKSTLSRLRF